MRMSIGEGIAGKVAQTGEPILVEDLSKDPRTARPDLVSEEGIKGFISIPLTAKDKVVGVMNVASHKAQGFGADDVSLLSSIGDYLGTTIEKAQLYERLARRKIPDSSPAFADLSRAGTKEDSPGVT
jgi:GAF domain-containing protein